MDVKKGDVVHVRMTVTDPDPMCGGYILFRDFTGDQFGILRKDIVHVEPRSLQVGDRVTWGSRAVIYEIVAVDYGIAFLRPTSPACAQHTTRLLADLVRA